MTRYRARPLRRRCADPGRPTGFRRACPVARFEIVDEAGQSRAARCSTVPRGRAVLLPIIFRDARCFQARCCWMRMTRIAASLLRGGCRPAGASPGLRRMPDVKLRAFIPPGERLELECEAGSPSGQAPLTIVMEARTAKGSGWAVGACASPHGGANMKRDAASRSRASGMVTPAGNSVADTWDSSARRAQSGLRPSATSMRAASRPHRRRGQALRRGCMLRDRKLLKFANRSHALRACRRRGSAARRGHSPDSRDTAGAGDARSAPA